jgi:cellulose synthase/poly-beta-1,6-N-acetylglucosamine synthase-like glycosyltransferase
MNKYNNNKKRYNNKEGNTRENYNNRERPVRKNFERTERTFKPEQEKSSGKNPNGFLVVSLFIKANTPQNLIVNSIESLVLIDHKKKIVISFEDQAEKQVISSIKKKFEGTFGVLFFTPKAKMTGSSVRNSSKIHTEVLHAFKSNFFLTMDASITLRQFSIEKMISFLCKDGDTLAVSPKFYTPSEQIVKTCRRFFSIWNFMPEFAEFIKTKNIEHLMMERGDIGYYSIHRIDYSTLDCMLFITDELMKIKSFPSCFTNQDLRDASACKRFYKKTGGKIIFYPHARAIMNNDDFNKIPSFSEKLKYFL